MPPLHYAHAGGWNVGGRDKDLYGAEGVNWGPDQTIARDVEIYVESCNQLIKQ